MSEKQQKLLEKIKLNDFDEVSVVLLDSPFTPIEDRHRWANVKIEHIGYGYYSFQDTLIVKHKYYYTL